MDTRAILFTKVNEVGVGDVEVPAPEAGEVLIETRYTCISPGTELRCLAGLQEGTPGWPFIPGYALVGTVVERGRDATLPVGTRVLCGGTNRSSVGQLWGGHVGMAVESERYVHPIPEEVDQVEAAVARLAAIAHHGVSVSRPQPQEQVAVVGLGIIGQLSARLHGLSGARVVAADLSPERVETARRAGIEAFVPQGSLAESFREYFPWGADLVVDSTGVPAVLPDSIRIARDQAYDDSLTPGARLLIQGSYPADFTVPYMTAFRKELSLLLPRDRQPRDMRAALELIRDGKLQVRDLVSEVRPRDEAPAAYAGLRAGSDGLLTVAFDWS
jgi:2-desacetyl-2-hydroxyethyl bacteriochlorophyllide A dehydrogenase